MHANVADTDFSVSAGGRAPIPNSKESMPRRWLITTDGFSSKIEDCSLPRMTDYTVMMVALFITTRKGSRPCSLTIMRTERQKLVLSKHSEIEKFQNKENTLVVNRCDF